MPAERQYHEPVTRQYPFMVIRPRAIVPLADLVSPNKMDCQVGDEIAYVSSARGLDALGETLYPYFSHQAAGGISPIGFQMGSRILRTLKDDQISRVRVTIAVTADLKLAPTHIDREVESDITFAVSFSHQDMEVKEETIYFTPFTTTNHKGKKSGGLTMRSREGRVFRVQPVFTRTPDV